MSPTRWNAPMSDDEDDAGLRRGWLAARGLRATRPRLAVLAELAAADQALDAVSLHRRVGRRDPRIRLPAVYRTLREFARGGGVRACAVPRGRMAWRLAAPLSPPSLPSSPTVLDRLAEQAARLGYRLGPAASIRQDTP